MPVFGRSRVLLLPTNRRPTRRCLSGILFEQIVSNPWVSPSQNDPSGKSRRERIRPSRADSQNNRYDRTGTDTTGSAADRSSRALCCFLRLDLGPFSSSALESLRV